MTTTKTTDLTSADKIFDLFLTVERDNHGPEGDWVQRLDVYREHFPTIVSERLLDTPTLRTWWHDRTGTGEPSQQIVESLLPWALEFERPNQQDWDHLVRVIGMTSYSASCRRTAITTAGTLLDRTDSTTGTTTTFSIPVTPIVTNLESYLIGTPTAYWGVVRPFITRLGDDVRLRELIDTFDLR